MTTQTVTTIPGIQECMEMSRWLTQLAKDTIAMVDQRVDIQPANGDNILKELKAFEEANKAIQERNTKFKSLQMDLDMSQALQLFNETKENMVVEMVTDLVRLLVSRCQEHSIQPKFNTVQADLRKLKLCNEDEILSDDLMPTIAGFLLSCYELGMNQDNRQTDDYKKARQTLFQTYNDHLAALKTQMDKEAVNTVTMTAYRMYSILQNRRTSAALCGELINNWGQNPARCYKQFDRTLTSVLKRDMLLTKSSLITAGIRVVNTFAALATVDRYPQANTTTDLMNYTNTMELIKQCNAMADFYAFNTVDAKTSNSVAQYVSENVIAPIMAIPDTDNNALRTLTTTTRLLVAFRELNLDNGQDSDPTLNPALGRGSDLLDSYENIYIPDTVVDRMIAVLTTYNGVITEDIKDFSISNVHFLRDRLKTLVSLIQAHTNDNQETFKLFLMLLEEMNKSTIDMTVVTMLVDNINQTHEPYSDMVQLLIQVVSQWRTLQESIKNRTVDAITVQVQKYRRIKKFFDTLDVGLSMFYRSTLMDLQTLHGHISTSLQEMVANGTLTATDIKELYSDFNVPLSAIVDASAVTESGVTSSEGLSAGAVTALWVIIPVVVVLGVVGGVLAFKKYKRNKQPTQPPTLGERPGG